MMEAVTAMMTANITEALVKKQRLFFATPTLHWPSALTAWGAAWPLHVYLAALAYIALALWALIHAIRVLVVKQMPGRPYYLALNLVILACSPGRATALLVDPYGSAKILTRLQTRLVGMLLFPSITGAFILVFATLLKITKMQIVSPRLVSPKMITFVVLLNYTVALVADLLAGVYVSLTVMLLFCESYFVLWGIVASSAYFYVFYQLYIGTVVNRRKLNQISEGKKDADSGNFLGEKSSSGKKDQELTTKLPVAAKITLVAAACFLAVSILHIWRLLMAVVYFFQGWEYANHWQWFMYNTLLRLAELMMCGTVLYIGSLPLWSKNRK